MALKLKSGRQPTLLAYIDIVLADLVTTVAKNLIELPHGAVVIGGGVVVSQVFNSTTSDVLDIGDAGVANRYKDNVNLQALGFTALIPTGYVTTAPTKITGTWTSGGGVPTTGAARLFVEYFVQGRVLSNQGLDA